MARLSGCHWCVNIPLHKMNKSRPADAQIWHEHTHTLSAYWTCQTQFPDGLQWPAISATKRQTLILPDTPKHTLSDSMWHRPTGSRRGRCYSWPNYHPQTRHYTKIAVWRSHVHMDKQTHPHRGEETSYIVSLLKRKQVRETDKCINRGTESKYRS